MTKNKESTLAPCEDTLCSCKTDCITDFEELQQQFVPRVEKSIKLVKSYERIGKGNKSARVSECGTLLAFRRGISDDGEVSDISQLHKANFCYDRLCPMCQWRRSRKMYAQMHRIADVIENDYCFLFLTLTIPNVSGADFSRALCDIQNAWKNITKTKKWKNLVRGYVRSLETTYNATRHDFHPHLHILLAVDKNYFFSDNYIPQSEWLEMWRSATQNNSIIAVDIRKITKNERREGSALSDTLAEVCKYPIKPIDDEKLSSEEYDDVVRILSVGLKGQHLVSLGGIFKEVQKKLKLDDIEEGDLINTDLEETRKFNAYIVTWYGRAVLSSVYLMFKRDVEVLGEQ